MIGSIGGDIAGSFREFEKDKRPELGLFPMHLSSIDANDYGLTDDSLLTLATCQACLDGKTSPMDFAKVYHAFGNKYKEPIGGFGGRFKQWLTQPDLQPYNSCGNGSAMRVSPVAYFCNSIDEVLEMSKYSAECTHNHPEGIKGAQNVALRIWMNLDKSKSYDVNYELQQRNLQYVCRTEPFTHFDAICQDTMQLVTGIVETAHMYSNPSYEKVTYKAVTLPNADSDTLGAIVGGIAESAYGLPMELEKHILTFFNDYPDLRYIAEEFIKFRNYKYKENYND